MAQNWLSKAVPVQQQESPRAGSQPEWLSKATPVGSSPSTTASTPSWMQKAVPVEPEKPVPEILRDEDLQAIASKHGVDVSELKQIAPYYGAITAPASAGEAVTQGLKGAAGVVGRGVGLGIPQFLYKKSQSAPMRAALDELTEIGRKQASIPEQAAEMVMFPAGAVGGALAKTAARRLGTAVATGAATGLGGSKEGEEVSSAATGAAFGGVLGVAAEGAGALLNHIANKYNPTKTEQALLQASKAEQANISQKIDELAERTKKSEALLEEIGTGQKTSLSAQEIDTVLDEQLGKESVAKYLDPSTEEGNLFRQKVRGRLGGETTEQAVKRQLADDLIDSRIREFASEFTEVKPKTVEEAVEAIREYAERQGGSQAVRDKYDQFVRGIRADRAIKENYLTVQGTGQATEKAANFFSDPQFVFQHLDDRAGTDLQLAHSQLNKDFSRSTFALKKFRKDQQALFDSARKAGVDDAIVNTDRIYQALDTGKVAGLTPQEQASAKQFQDYFENVRQFVNGLVKEKDPNITPLSIPKLENYVPKMMRPSGEIVNAVEKRMAQALDEVSARLGQRVDSLEQLGDQLPKLAEQSPALNDLVRTSRIYDGRPMSNGRELSNRLNEMLYTRAGHSALATRAKAAMERQGEIPEFLLERNLYRLARRYTDNTLRHLYLRKSIDRMSKEADILARVGDESGAQYVRNLISDVVGVRAGTFRGEMSHRTTQMLAAIDRAIDNVGPDSVKAIPLKWARSTPLILEALSRQIYPNLLGYWSVRAVLQNATQSITKVAPELGGSYGYGVVLRAGTKVARNMQKYVSEAERLGNLPAEFIRAGEQAIAQGIQRSTGFQLGSKAMDAMGKAGMVLFQKGEQANRAIVTAAAETMADDIARGSQLALNSLAKFPRSVRNQVLTSKADPKRMTEILAQHLNDVTQYNYNKASMSEFGRVMGPMFSVFSKWPTATFGDAVQIARSKGLLPASSRLVEKYVAPLLLLQGIDFVLGERMGEEKTDLQKKITGSGGLSQSAPIGSVKGVLAGEIFTPPVVDAAVQIVKAAAEGNGSALEKGGATVLKNFTPGAGLFRFITDDLVQYSDAIDKATK